ncbi:DUF1361 domain-containing protein [Streptococcus loxodontisalivarius]|uniref:Membrane protein n=1 Tax=Streptococcus loxodontisalivarius TaxID=1349415 RepID=A0ABS2PU54_9STRE|nr:DUF1361 domain-containing protein [Streptococcus loxodontisalivarius]MBM7643466.1 putative membrane protein [Streptococcus loxodontisalivarius]
MHKIIFSHLFVAFILFGILYYQPAVDGLMVSVILALVTLEAGFLAHHSGKSILRLLSLIVWLIFYPNTFNMLMGISSVSWSGTAVWTDGSMASFMVYLAALSFSVISGALSLQLILKSFNANLYTQFLLIPAVALLTSLSIHLGQTTSLGWSDFFLSPLNFLGQIGASLTLANIPFLIGMTFIQCMFLVLLGDD